MYGYLRIVTQRAADAYNPKNVRCSQRFQFRSKTRDKEKNRWSV